MCATAHRIYLQFQLERSLTFKLLKFSKTFLMICLFITLHMPTELKNFHRTDILVS